MDEYESLEPLEVVPVLAMLQVLRGFRDASRGLCAAYPPAGFSGISAVLDHPPACWRRIVPADWALALPEQGSAEAALAALVLNGARLGALLRAYAEGLAAFFRGVREQPPQPFAKALIEAWRVHLLGWNPAPVTVNRSTCAWRR